jgi:hypothetical protein
VSLFSQSKKEKMSSPVLKSTAIEPPEYSSSITGTFSKAKGNNVFIDFTTAEFKRKLFFSRKHVFLFLSRKLTHDFIAIQCAVTGPILRKIYK